MLVSIKSYGDKVFKVIYHKHGKRVSKGVEQALQVERVTAELSECELPPSAPLGLEGGTVNTCNEKDICNLYRAKGKVKEYALCNPWEWFVTLTLDKRKQDRYDLDGYVKDLGVWIGNYNKKYGTKLKYLLIPEQHQDGAWHMHGLIHGLAPESMAVNQNGYYTVPYYAERFGYISLSAVRDGQRASSYITKYVAKAFGCTQVALCKHSYYHSQGLQVAYEVGETCCEGVPEGVWENEYCGIEWLDEDGLRKRMEMLNDER